MITQIRSWLAATLVAVSASGCAELATAPAATDPRSDIWGANAPSAREIPGLADGVVHQERCGTAERPCPIDDLVVTVPGSTPTDNCIYLYTGPCDDPLASGGSGAPEPSGGGGGGSATGTTAFEQGPLAFTACVLSMLGSTYAIGEVALAFEDWYHALKDEAAAKRMWDLTIENNTDATTQQLYEYQYRQAVQRQRDKASAVTSQANASGWTIALAATACGFAIVLPTP